MQETEPDQLGSAVLHGDSEIVLAGLPDQSIDLVFTSPPYYNARPEYAAYDGYDAYMGKMKRILEVCFRLLADGRFLVLNSSPVLVPRTTRQSVSKRLPVPFDLHHAACSVGFEFLDDIIWQKPEGAGWATTRGARFAADRQPLQYKPAPVTEYLMVYRKRADVLIDSIVRSYSDEDAAESKIADGYETTNVWQICPSASKEHPATFPEELAEKVVRYYSYVGDMVLDPFAGVGTTALACAALNRRFIAADVSEEYIRCLKSNLVDRMGRKAENVRCQGTEPIAAATLF